MTDTAGSRRDHAGNREIALPVDPAESANGPRLMFIGKVHSPWTKENPPPKNPTAARERGGSARLLIDPPFRPALLGLDRFSHLIVLAWLHAAARTALVITPPRADAPSGVFALRSPVRPNPIGLSVARVLGVDPQTGVVDIDAIDFLDGTPLVDVKPYRPGIDAVPDAVVG